MKPPQAVPAESVTSASPLEGLPPFPAPPLAIAVSECLTGANVRYDGGNRGECWPRQALDKLFLWRPLCPEVGIGLGVPRPPIQLVEVQGATKAVGRQDAGMEVTAQLRGYADAQATVLARVDGCVFKAKSPSCGLFGVAVADGAGKPLHTAGRGVVAARIGQKHPALPLEEGERLFDAAVRQNFIMRVFIHARWRSCVAAGMAPGTLIAFHSACKYLLMAHDVAAYRRLGRMLSHLAGDVDAIAGRYFPELMRALACLPDRAGHANALAHLQGHLRSQSLRRQLARCIERYRRGDAPLAAPLSLLKGGLEEQRRSADAPPGTSYAASQHYLRVYPTVA